MENLKNLTKMKNAYFYKPDFTNKKYYFFDFEFFKNCNNITAAEKTKILDSINTNENITFSYFNDRIDLVYFFNGKKNYCSLFFLKNSIYNSNTGKLLYYSRVCCGFVINRYKMNCFGYVENKTSDFVKAGILYPENETNEITI